MWLPGRGNTEGCVENGRFWALVRKGFTKAPKKFLPEGALKMTPARRRGEGRKGGDI